MSPEYLLVSESVLDAALANNAFDPSSMLPKEESGIHRFAIGKSIVGYKLANEPPGQSLALVGAEWLALLKEDGGAPSEVFRRVARVVKGMKSPPVHLPRHWSEYHHKNLLTFFALPRPVSSRRWVVEINSEIRCVKFDYLTSSESVVDVAHFEPSAWPDNIASVVARFAAEELRELETPSFAAIAPEFDLEAVGSRSVVEGRSYEEWLALLSDSQKNILKQDIKASIRILGPAGSGKTLALCMRAIQISRDQDVLAQGRRLLVATHSWAMAERTDGILKTLNGGSPADTITVFPLLSLLELHAGQIGRQRTNVIGDDSSEGRLKSIEIIGETISKLDLTNHPGVASWIGDAVSAARDSRQRLDLTLDLYDEISGVLTSSGVSSDDPESIEEYLATSREDWMPPFETIADRGLVIEVYRSFMQELVDRSAITTDQFVLDSIRVLETFTWRMRKETEGYDYILVDELQVFDPQERTALQLLGRSRRGVPFITAEDPAQGVFSSLNARRATVENVPVYLEVVHRFNEQIFEFISFIYRAVPPQRPSASHPRYPRCRHAASGDALLLRIARRTAIAAASGLVADIHRWRRAFRPDLRRDLSGTSTRKGC